MDDRSDGRASDGPINHASPIERLRRDRDALHAELRTLLTGYGDDELTHDDRARVEAHLVSCGNCEKDLAVQLTLRSNFADLGPSATSAREERRLREMLIQSTRTTTGNASNAARERTPRFPLPAAIRWPRRMPRTVHGARALARWSGWLAAAALAGIMLTRSTSAPSYAPVASTRGQRADSARIVTLDSIPVPMVAAALADYAQRTASELPHERLNTDSVLAALPFRVATLSSAEVRIVAFWMTEIGGEPVAAIAYRWRDQVVVQYGVSERLFFRQSRVRHALARGSLYAVRKGGVSAVAWPNARSGSILIGDALPTELAVLRS